MKHTNQIWEAIIPSSWTIVTYYLLAIFMIKKNEIILIFFR